LVAVTCQPLAHVANEFLPGHMRGSLVSWLRVTGVFAFILMFIFFLVRLCAPKLCRGRDHLDVTILKLIKLLLSKKSKMPI
jgi:hypothetical protein